MVLHPDLLHVVSVSYDLSTSSCKKHGFHRIQISYSSGFFFVSHHSSRLVFIIIPKNHNSDCSVDKNLSEVTRLAQSCTVGYARSSAQCVGLSPIFSAHFPVMSSLLCDLHELGWLYLPLKGVS